ncbi:MAG: acyl-CoA thioesterase [Woronichinia naegeliana WA131]|uniref:Acyl-CoA thioesterase n=1 Tax=Woronichinia naegeliana WA131 TaxID=2824559 RepID=A0A977PZ01_9CYAN|nr:MAG: acyl-CoA thioesterase [Woronichinia naegeliana WA131]
MSATPQLPSSTAIAVKPPLKAESEKWFEYVVRVQPHHTDYAGVVWHGTYLTWMETARVECLRSIGIDFAELVKMGCDLPVVELTIRYHRPIRMGQTAVVKTIMNQIQGVRLDWDYRLECLETKELCLTAKVTLVAIDLEKGKIMRQLPSAVQDILVKL